MERLRNLKAARHYHAPVICVPVQHSAHNMSVYIYIYVCVALHRGALRVTLPPEEGPRILQVEQSGGHPQSITTALPSSRGTELSRSAVEC